MGVNNGGGNFSRRRYFMPINKRGKQSARSLSTIVVQYLPNGMCMPSLNIKLTFIFSLDLF